MYKNNIYKALKDLMHCMHEFDFAALRTGLYLLKHSRGPEKVPFRQEAFKNKKKENKRVTITKHNMDKFM